MSNILDYMEFTAYYEQFIINNPVLSYFEALSFSIYDWTLVFAILFVSIEILDDIVEGRMNKGRISETLSSFEPLSKEGNLDS